MKKQKKSQSKIASDDQLMIAGIAKHMGSGTTQLRSKKYEPSDLVAILEARIDKIAAAKSARAAWRKATAEKNALIAQTDEVVLALKHHLLVA